MDLLEETQKMSIMGVLKGSRIHKLINENSMRTMDSQDRDQSNDKLPPSNLSSHK